MVVAKTMRRRPLGCGSTAAVCFSSGSDANRGVMAMDSTLVAPLACVLCADMEVVTELGLGFGGGRDVVDGLKNGEGSAATDHSGHGGGASSATDGADNTDVHPLLQLRAHIAQVEFGIFSCQISKLICTVFNASIT